VSDIGLNEDLDTLQTTLQVNLPSTQIIPGSIFYPTKLFWEEVRLFLSRTPEEKTRFLLHLAEVRLSEVTQLIQNQQTPLAQQTLTVYHETLKRAETVYADLEPSQTLNTRLDNQYAKNELVSQLLGEYHLEWTR